MVDYIDDIKQIIEDQPPLAQMEGCYVFDHNQRRMKDCSKY